MSARRRGGQGLMELLALTALQASLALLIGREACAAEMNPAAAPTAVSAAEAQADTAAPVRPLTEAEVKSRYQNCPNGYYSGPRPGKVRFTRDNFVWAVTPEFAAKFCMPPEFISTELKGAEAVAYRMQPDSSGENCGFGNRAGVCSAPVNHRFEICYRNGLIPKKRDFPYFQVANLPSALLITPSESEQTTKYRSVKAKPRVGAMGVFGDLFSVLALDHPLGHWPLGSISPEIYYEEVFEGVDFLALDLSSGFSMRPDWQRAAAKGQVAKQLAIVLSRPGETRKRYETPLADFVTVIPLPLRMAEAIIANDSQRGDNIRALADKALGPMPAASTAR